MVLSQSFNGAGDTFTPTLINFIGSWLVQIPLAYLLAITFNFGSNGVYLAIAFTAILLAGMNLYVFKKGKWKLVDI
jgi:Na+-driven multidrug efflux pump